MPSPRLRPKHLRAASLSVSAELEVRLGGGTPAERLAVLGLDRHDCRLPRFWIQSAVACAKRGDAAAALEWLQAARDVVLAMERRR